MRKVFVVAYCWLGLLFVQGIRAELTDSILAQAQISLLTCDPGDEIYSLFGHSAIRIKSTFNDLDVVYNYGTFDFDTPNFTIKFMRGKLPYKLTLTSFNRFMAEYQYFRRGVREQVFNLNNDQKKEVILFLEHNLRPENAEYQYDFFYDNCSSRIRDVVEKTFKITPEYRGKNNLTLRDQLHEYQISHPWTKLGIDMIIGAPADLVSDPRQQMFLPDYLHDNLATAQLGHLPLLTELEPLLNFAEEKEKRNTATWYGPWLINVAFLLLFLVFYFGSKPTWLTRLVQSWYIFAGLGGLMIIFLWFFTDHQATKNNWNLLWLNPLYFILLFNKETIGRRGVVFLLSIMSLTALINGWFDFIPQQMPILSCVVPAFLMPMAYEWLIRKKISKN